jgi:5-methyltetrahydropteroyltriglutamate--homocysteine methyltransferase
MSIQRSTERILTTHVGSLARPRDLLDLMKVKAGGSSYDHNAYEQRIRSAVIECVRRQADAGIDVVTDGEQSKIGFSAYTRERIEGFEARPHQTGQWFAAEAAAFPEYYGEYFQQAMLGGSVAPALTMVCVGPISYRDEGPLRRDIDNLKTAAAGVPHHAIFMPAVSPSGVGGNEYYATEEEFFHAVGAALRTEYNAIVDAGFLLQIDDPFLSEVFVDPRFDTAQQHRRANMYVEAVNESIRGIPAEKVRYHTCYGINEGPRIHEASLDDVARYLLKVNACAYSFEAANARHEHEYHLWERLKLPDGKVLIPGVITHASNIVEHPQLIAERLLRFAKLVGRESVVAGADCGFSSQATYRTEVHPTVVWAKFAAMREGARLASQQLWS